MTVAIVSVSVGTLQKSKRPCIMVLREDGGEHTAWVVPDGIMAPEELATELEKFVAKIRENGK